MALRESKIFRGIGYGLVSVAVLSAVAHIVQIALSGGWNESYRSAKLIRWTYGGAMVVVVFGVVVGLVGLCFFLKSRWQRAQRP